MNQHDVATAFENAMKDAGIVPVWKAGQGIEFGLAAGGKPHRFHVKGHSKGSRNGHYLLFADGVPAGYFGCFKAGAQENWCAKAHAEMSDSEREAVRARMEEAHKARQLERVEREAKAAFAAETLWDAATDATDDHAYLLRKSVRAHGVRVATWPLMSADGKAWGSVRNALLVPLRDITGKLWSLQAIFPARRDDLGRDKDFLSGGKKHGTFHLIGTPSPDGVIVVAEGYSTACSIHEITGHPVAVAFDAGNLPAVSKALRAKYQHARFIHAADNDQWTLKPVTNPGRHFAVLASRETGGIVVFPDFNSSDPDKPTDWNDAAMRGDVEYIRQSFRLDSGRDEERRKAQKEENARLQNEVIATEPKIWSLDEMEDRLVWVADGEIVSDLHNPHGDLKFSEFRSMTAASVVMMESDDGKRRKRIPTAVIWQASQNRNTVLTRTFHAGAASICRDPKGREAVNKWRRIDRTEAKRDIGPFLDHVVYLFADEAPLFLDWLAHIEQNPGVLPHYGWLHVANRTGTGRNWLASVLARVWRGQVAPNVNLVAMLESPYNGELAGSVLAIVDEVQDGGGDKRYAHINKLKQMVNAETRSVNPKFGRQYSEWNACRWLVFSNHLNAIPIDDEDRRWRAVHFTGTPMQASHYARLYGLLADPEFINAVGAYLMQRDISQFNPGERPPVNAAKKAITKAGKSTMQLRADEIMADWPSDVITINDIASIINDGADDKWTSGMRRAMDEAGATAFDRQVRVSGVPRRVWLLRNIARWMDAEPRAIGTEAMRARRMSGEPAIDVLADAQSFRADDPF